MIALWSLGAMLAGFALDWLFGDPYSLPHIVRFMGSLISALEKPLRRIFSNNDRLGGVALVILVILISSGIPLVITGFCYRLFPPLGFALESFLCYQLIAAKSLKDESMKVYHSLLEGDIDGARKNVSMIVGRDTSVLDEDGIARAAVETVAENASDGVAAPLMYIMLGGAALGCLYKAVNTMDSMVGYKNDKYIDFGRFAAKTDDVLNYIPARLCALLMIISAYLLGFDGKNAHRIWRRDRFNHASPNSAQTESACAGALGLRLAGPAVYFGITHEKPYIGDELREINADDIINANRLMYAASVLMMIIAVVFRAAILGVTLYGAL